MKSHIVIFNIVMPLCSSYERTYLKDRIPWRKHIPYRYRYGTVTYGTMWYSVVPYRAVPYGTGTLGETN